MSSAGIAARPAGRGWLFGPGTDLLIGCGLGYVLSVPVLYFASVATGAVHWPAPLVLVMAMFVNAPHYGATIVRVYDAREDRRKYVVFSVYITVALAFVLVVSSWNVWVASLLITAYVTWSPWHFSGQNYGLMLMLLGRRGIDVDPTTKRLVYGSFVFSAALAIMAVHSGREEIVFAPRTLDVVNAPTIFTIPLVFGEIFASAAVLAYLGCLGGAAWRLRSRGRPRDLAPAFVVVLTQALWFTIPAIAFDWSAARGGTLFFAAAWVSTAHSLQYLWVTAYYARSSGQRESSSRFLLKSFLAGSAVTTIPTVLLAPNLLGGTPLDAGLAAIAFAIVNLHHFVLDGAIWKLRDGRVARVLLRAPDPPNLPEPIAAAPRRVGMRRLVWSVAGLTIAIPAIDYYATSIIGRTDQTDRVEAATRVLRWIGRERVTSHIDIGLGLASTGDHEGAIRHFRRSIELFPTGRAWGALGDRYRALGQWDLALAAFDSALELNPTLSRAHYRRAQALLETASSTAAADVYDQAIASLERALELSPGFAKAALMLAGMQVEAGRTEHAIITLQRALVEAGAADATPIRRELQMLQRSKGKANLPP
jgi:hypothetical protein